MKNRKTLNIAAAGVVAALYVALTFVGHEFSYMSIQCRLSEALTILPVFFPAAIPGLTLGCFIANIVSPAGPWDMLFGTLATLIAAVLGALLRKIVVVNLSRPKLRYPLLSFLMPVLANGFIIALLLKYFTGLEDGYWMLFASVAIGEAAVVFIFGSVLWRVFDRLTGTNRLINSLCYKDLRRETSVFAKEKNGDFSAQSEDSHAETPANGDPVI